MYNPFDDFPDPNSWDFTNKVMAWKRSHQTRITQALQLIDSQPALSKHWLIGVLGWYRQVQEWKQTYPKDK